MSTKAEQHFGQIYFSEDASMSMVIIEFPFHSLED